MFGSISGNHINPAFTIGLAVSGLFPWKEVLPYILVQFAGAIVGQLLVVAAYKPHYDMTTNPQHILGTFSTINATKSKFNGFVNEFIGSYILFIGALGITKRHSSPRTLGSPTSGLASSLPPWLLVLGAQPDLP